MRFLQRNLQRHRKRIVQRTICHCLVMTAFITTAALLLGAQYARPRGKGPHAGPRAIAVLEQLPAPKGSTKPSTRYRIVPVTIFYQGQYYDGAIYKASPVPMALIPETVYAVERGGSPLGTIEVGLPSPTPRGWRSDGTLADTSKEKEPEHKPALGEATAAQTSDDRPHLHRGADHPSTAPPASPQPSAPTSSPSPTSGEASSAAAPSPASDSSAPEPDDPNRPRLQRGKPAQTSSATAAEENTTAEERKPSAPRPPDLVGISDVERNDPHVYTLLWPKSDLDRLTQAATQQAQAEVAKYVKEHFPAASQPVASPPRSTAGKRVATHANASTAAPPLQDVEVHIFDLDFDNDPEIVLTARQPVTGADGSAHSVFVAYVVRQEGGHDYHPLLTYLTDDTRLDEFPRLKLIDAVDGDGDGIGELLFRTSSAVEAEEENFRLYATGPDRLRIVFDSRGGQD